jgi:hypothetical protein
MRGTHRLALQKNRHCELQLNYPYELIQERRK